MKVTKALLAAIGLTALGTACTTPPAAPKRVTYENTIKQLTDRRCAACHGAQAPTMEAFKQDQEAYKAKNLGPRMDTYEHLMVMISGSDTGAIMRRLDDGANSKDGTPGNMYVHLGNTDTERAANLALFKQWVGSWNLKRAKDISDEERKAVLAPRN